MGSSSSRSTVAVDLPPPPLEVYIKGPYGSPCSDIYRAEHAVLIATGIGVTPYASLLQSIMAKYGGSTPALGNLRKVDFIWVSR